MKAIIELKDKDDLPDIINKKVFVLTMKWKKEIDDWLKNPIPTQFEQEIAKKESNSPLLEDSLNKKRVNPKYLEKEKDPLNEKTLDKRPDKKLKNLDRDKNKKKAKYERKKDNNHHHKMRETKEISKNIKGKLENNNKYISNKKKEHEKKTKIVRFFYF